MKKRKMVTPHIADLVCSLRYSSSGFFSDSTRHVPPARTLVNVPFGWRLLVSAGWRCRLASQTELRQKQESNIRRHHSRLAAANSASHLSPFNAGRNPENRVKDGRALPDHATPGDGDMLLAKSCNDTVTPRDLSKGASSQSCLILGNKRLEL